MARRLVRQTWDLKVESLSPGRCVYVVFLDKTLNSGVQTGTRQIALGTTSNGLVSHPRAVEILLVASYYTNLQWTSIPFRGSRNTPSCFILH